MKYITFASILLSLFSCVDNCSDCENFLDDYIDNLSVYEEGDLITYTNVYGDVKIDTIRIDYEIPSGTYDCWKYKEGHYCGGHYYVSFDNFTIGYSQGMSTKNIGPYELIALGGTSFYSLSDTIHYSGNNFEITAYHYTQIDSTDNYFNQINYNNYYDFYISEDNLLLEYSLKFDDKLETWYLEN